MIFLNEAISFALSLAGNIFLAGIFVSSLLHPEIKSLFYQTGAFMYIMEFLSIHSSGIAFGIRKHEHQNSQQKFANFFSVPGLKNFLRTNQKFSLVFFYTLFATGIGIIASAWYVPLYFFVSIAIKFFGKKALGDELRIGLPVLLFIMATIISFIILPFFTKIFSYGAKSVLTDSSGAFMAWGIVYFVSLSFAEIVLFIKKSLTRPGE